MSEEFRKNDEDDTPRTGTEIEWRDGEIPSGPPPEEEEDVPRGAHVETRSAGQKEGTQTDAKESDPPRG